MKEQLSEVGIVGEAAEPFWMTVRSNIEKVSDAKLLWPIVRGTIRPVIRDAEFAAMALDALPEIIDGETWSLWTGAIRAASGRKGKQLFTLLCLMLTGQERGPELAPLLQLMGRERIVARLKGNTA